MIVEEALHLTLSKTKATNPLLHQPNAIRQYCQNQQPLIPTNHEELLGLQLRTKQIFNLSFMRTTSHRVTILICLVKGKVKPVKIKKSFKAKFFKINQKSTNPNL